MRGVIVPWIKTTRRIPTLEIGIDSFAATIMDAETATMIAPSDRLQNLIEEIELADQVGLDFFCGRTSL